jgi:hypothetical protein
VGIEKLALQPERPFQNPEYEDELHMSWGVTPLGDFATQRNGGGSREKDL